MFRSVKHVADLGDCVSLFQVIFLYNSLLVLCTYLFKRPTWTCMKEKVIIIFVSSLQLLFFSSLHFQTKFHANWIHFIAYNPEWQCQCNKASQEHCLPLKNKTYWARYALHQRQINYIPSEEQIADILTKLLTFIHFNHFRAKLNVHPCLLNLRGAGC